MIDVDYALTYMSPDLDDARHERVLHSPIALALRLNTSLRPAVAG